jgi:hypothetical protein
LRITRDDGGTDFARAGLIGVALFGEVQVRRVRIVSLAIVVFVTGWTATACKSQGAQPSPSSSTSMSGPSPTASLAPGPAAIEAAVAAYRNMWRAYDTAIHVPDPNDPDLAKYASGDALRTLVSGLQSVKDQGLKGTGAVVNTPQVSQLSPSDAPRQVSIKDCMDTSQSRLVRSGPGPVYSDSPGGHRPCLADVRRQDDGLWKVASFGVRGVGTC